MPIIDNELVGEGVIDNDGLFHPSRYVPSVTGQSIVEKIQENVELYGDITWMTDLNTGKSMTYSQLAVVIDRLHNSLRRRGLRPRDTLALVSANHIEIPIVYFAVWKACGSCCGMDIGLFTEQIRNRLIETGVRFIVTDELGAAKVLQAAQGLDIPVFVIGQAEGCIPIAQLLNSEEQGDNLEEVEFDVNCPAWFTYSSGTTGIPKGIVHTHFSLSPYLRPSDDKNERSDLAGQKFIFTGSMIHGSGLFSFMSATIEHQTIFTFTDPKLEALLHGIDLIKPRRISIFPNELAEICLHPEIDKYDLSSVETLIYCGSSTLSTFERQIFKIMPNLHNLFSMYGMSETMLLTLDKPKPKPTVKIDREEIIKSHKVGSSGKVLPFAKIKIIDSTRGEKLGPGGIGEVVAYTPFLMKGYLNQPTEVNDGWFKTGDQGYYDVEGNLFIIGRYKELIKYKSKKVAPSSIETQLMTHSAVKDVAVVGLHHEVDGEHPLAYVVIKTDEKSRPLASPQELIDYTNERVVDHEQLRGGVRFIENIPRNKLGKIQRHQLVTKLQGESTSSDRSI